jgi:ribose 5-phosphate isomerase A
MHEFSKKDAAIKALHFIQPDCILGIGTGSTVNYLISELPQYRSKISAIVSSSKASTEKLVSLGFKVSNLNDVGAQLDLYIDGADEINPQKEMIKGGGGALTQEKILAECAKKFICIIDPSKMVKVLGKFPVPIEVIASAKSLVARKMIALGGTPQLRENFITDQGNLILDIHQLDLTQPRLIEEKINMIPGVVTVGIFAHRTADIVIQGATLGLN